VYSEIVLTRGRWAELSEKQNAHDKIKVIQDRKGHENRRTCACRKGEAR